MLPLVNAPLMLDLADIGLVGEQAAQRPIAERIAASGLTETKALLSLQRLLLCLAQGRLN